MDRPIFKVYAGVVDVRLSIKALVFAEYELVDNWKALDELRFRTGCDGTFCLHPFTSNL